MACGCNSNRKNSCGKRQQAVCVEYQSDLPEFSEYYDEDCITVEELIEELYVETASIKDSIDLSDLDGDCLDFDQEDPDELKVREVLTSLVSAVCELQSETESEIQELDITGWGLDYGCLVDACGNQPSTLQDLLQLIIYKICE